MPIDAHLREAILAQPQQTWTLAVDADHQPHDGAQVCELTGWVDLGSWPPGTRALCRREDAHPGAQLRFTDHDGHRFQVFVTDQPGSDLAHLELRHRQRARVEDRIRSAKATGLRNLPFDRWRRNAVWLELVLAAQDLVCFTQALLLDGALALAEPKTLRYRLLHVAARIVHHARRVILRLQRSWPWAARWTSPPHMACGRGGWMLKLGFIGGCGMVCGCAARRPACVRSATPTRRPVWRSSWARCRWWPSSAGGWTWTGSSTVRVRLGRARR